ncbi:tRNA-specific adenosine deaminase subunit tad3 [Ascosphaera pollenicola]|nr:tRNA-specific adenosine deaminase subunit tad3 [Ascosphaera pollenicola]
MSLEVSPEALKGSLLPLKTVQETRAVDNLVDAYVAEINIKCSNKTLKLLDSTIPQPASLSLSHLRRFARPEHLPAPLKAQVSGEAGCMYLLIPPPLPDVTLLRELLSQFAFIPASVSATTRETVVETGKRKRPAAEDADAAAGDDANDAEFCSTAAEKIEETTTVVEKKPALKLLQTKIPLNPPTSLAQAQAWSSTLWPTQFNAAAQPATHSPPPALISEIKRSIAPRAGQYLALAKKLAKEARHSGRGRAAGIVIVDPDVKPSEENPWSGVVAAAGDARYWEPAGAVTDVHDRNDDGVDGHPERHAMMRAITMVSNKRLASEPTAITDAQQINDYNPPMIKAPLTSLESRFTQHAQSPSYLCTNLDAYITHEPCIMCSMGMLLSRFRSVTFLRSTERADAALDPYVGYGLHWRKELNWRAVAFQFVQEAIDEEVVENEKFNA